METPSENNLLGLDHLILIGYFILACGDYKGHSLDGDR